MFFLLIEANIEQNSPPFGYQNIHLTKILQIIFVNVSSGSPLRFFSSFNFLLFAYLFDFYTQVSLYVDALIFSF